MDIKKYYKDLRRLFGSPQSFNNIHKFTLFMNRKARTLGMNNSHFDSPSGASSCSYSTAYYLDLLSCAFFKNDILRSYSSAETLDINGRRIINDALAEGLSVFGRPLSLKTGTWGDTNKALCICTADNNVLCLMSNDVEVYDRIFDVSYQIINNILPPPIKNNRIAYYGCINGRVLSHNKDTRFVSASTVKLLTALCVYDICDLDDIVEIKASDIERGSGSKYHPGEMFTVKCALKIMLMESSNTLANTLADKCGAMLD